MWLLASGFFAMFILWPAGFDVDDGRNPGFWTPLGVAVLCFAVALFIGSAPVAYAIGQRRWLLVMPVLGASAWLLGVAIAVAT